VPTGQAQRGAGTDPRDLLEFATRAERLGYDSLFVNDSLLTRRIEALTMLAALAPVTKHATLGTAALLPFLRRPMQTAQTLASIDRVGRTSGGGRRRGIPRSLRPAPVPPVGDAVGNADSKAGRDRRPGASTLGPPRTRPPSTGRSSASRTFRLRPNRSVPEDRRSGSGAPRRPRSSAPAVSTMDGSPTRPIRPTGPAARGRRSGPWPGRPEAAAGSGAAGSRLPP
jgi:Luciferase-like monooxygenase